MSCIGEHNCFERIAESIRRRLATEELTATDRAALAYELTWYETEAARAWTDAGMETRNDDDEQG